MTSSINGWQSVSRMACTAWISLQGLTPLRQAKASATSAFGRASYVLLTFKNTTRRRAPATHVVRCVFVKHSLCLYKEVIGCILSPFTSEDQIHRNKLSRNQYKYQAVFQKALGANIPSRSPIIELIQKWSVRQYSKKHWQFGALGVPWPLMEWTFRCYPSNHFKIEVARHVKSLQQSLKGRHTHWKSDADTCRPINLWQQSGALWLPVEHSLFGWGNWSPPRTWRRCVVVLLYNPWHRFRFLVLVWSSVFPRAMEVFLPPISW